MDNEILYELRRSFLDGWLSREELMDAYQRGILEWWEYLWVIGAVSEPVKKSKIIVE